jgi:hypothetical protein
MIHTFKITPIFNTFEKSAGALGADRPRWDPFVNARGWGLSQIIKRASAPQTARCCAVDLSKFNDKKGSSAAGSMRLWPNSRPMERHALGVAPPRAVRARLVMRLGGHSAIHPEKARLVAAAHEYTTKAVRADYYAAAALYARSSLTSASCQAAAKASRSWKASGLGQRPVLTRR